MKITPKRKNNNLNKFYKNLKIENKKYLEKEKEEYKSLPFKFEIGEEVLIVKGNLEKIRSIKKGLIIRHSVKSYSVEDKFYFHTKG